MLIEETHTDVLAEGGSSMRTASCSVMSLRHTEILQAFSSTIPKSPIIQMPAFLVWLSSARSIKARPFAAQSLYRSSLSNRSPVTGPVARFARQIAGQGYIVAAPSSFHDFVTFEPLAYDVPGTDAGNDYKVKKVCFPRRMKS